MINRGLIKGGKMLKKSGLRTNLFVLAIVISIVLVVAVFFFSRTSNKVPTRGFFVENIKYSSFKY